MASIKYTPPPTIRLFIRDHLPGKLFQSWIVGPVGSGKTTGIFFKLIHMAKLQEPGPDGVRRTRAVVVRNTAPQLRDTTLVSWGYWFKDGQAGDWHATDKNFVLRFGDVECEVLFRPLDTPQDIARVLSLEVTFAILDEFVNIPKEIIEALGARCGRYRIPGGPPCTNFGMWGSSNPGTEDVWWFDYLHNAEIVERIAVDMDMTDFLTREAFGVGQRNVRYFHQPSGLTPEAENVENLPPDYYANQISGKSDAWVKQFIESEWGFSVAGRPVVPAFKAPIHVSAKPLIYNPLLPLVAGLDPGLGGTAFVFMQQDIFGRLLVLGELTTVGIGMTRVMNEHLKPYLRRRFPNLISFIIAPDPAAANRTQTDERTVVDVLRKTFEVSIESNNRLPLRLDAIEHFATRLTDYGPALLIDPVNAPTLIRALKGGWRWALDTKRDQQRGSEPEKNPWSHTGDAFGYGCRYFHKRTDRELRQSPDGGRRFKPPLQFGGSYHVT